MLASLTSANSLMAFSWTEIDRAALRDNARLLCRVAGGAQLAPVVKAAGYGHGAVETARAALAGGAERLCVFRVAEAAPLRCAGLRAPVLVLAPTLPSEIDRAVGLDLTLSLRSREEVCAVERAASGAGRRISVHINIDAGMGRLGLTAGEALALAADIRAHDSLRLEGVYTHFPAADGGDPAPTLAALKRFLAAANAIGAPIRHAAASVALLRFPETRLEMVRPGLALYGAGPLPSRPARELQPALAWRAPLLTLREVRAGQSVSYGGRWTAQRDSRIGVLGVGYADGLFRSLSNRGQALVRGRRAPLIGAICMDMALIDLSGIPDAAEGDTATLIGRDGAEQISAQEMAERAGTIAYEVFTAISHRVERRWR